MLGLLIVIRDPGAACSKGVEGKGGAGIHQVIFTGTLFLHSRGTGALFLWLLPTIRFGHEPLYED